MLINRKTLPAHARWILFVVVATVAAIAWYGWYARSGATTGWPGGSSLPGLVLGTAAALIIVFEFLLWPRKWPRVRAWRIGRTQTWMKAHIWLGLLSVPLVILHHGLAFEWGGTLTVLLMLLFWGVILSGLVGLYLQQVLPSYMLHALPAESIVSQIPHLTRQMVDDAEQMLANASGSKVASAADRQQEGDRHMVVGAVRSLGHLQGKVLETQSAVTQKLERRDSAQVTTAFENTIKPFLLAERPHDSPLQNSTQAATFFAALRSSTSGDAAGVIDSLEQICNTRRQFEQQKTIHRLLHGWMIVHLPLSVALVVLLVAHVISAIRYAGIWPI